MNKIGTVSACISSLSLSDSSQFFFLSSPLINNSIRAQILANQCLKEKCVKAEKSVSESTQAQEIKKVKD